MMLPENRTPTHPGEILLEEFLRPLGLTPPMLAKHIGMPTRRVSEVIRRKRRVTPRTAWLLAQALGTSPEFWANLQSTFDLAKSQPKRQAKRLQKAG
jgi:addiction module HigA family antidote